MPDIPTPSTSYSQIDSCLSSIRQSNDDLRLIHDHLWKARHTQTRLSGLSLTPRIPNGENTSYQKIAHVSREVYESLSRYCTKHAEHFAFVGVEVGQVCEGSDVSRMIFPIAYTSVTVRANMHQADITLFKAEKLVEEPFWDVSLRESDVGIRDEFCHRHKHQIDRDLGSIPKVSKKSCQSNILPDIGLKKIAPNLEHLQLVSLEQVIRQSPRMSFYGRLRLAKRLAMAVLQYHSTPWLKAAWCSEDIYFFCGLEDLAEADAIWPSPYLSTKIEVSKSQTNQSPPHTFAPNPTLFSLAVVLLEIAHLSTLRSLQRAADLDNDQENQYSQFFLARRLASSSSEMGMAYQQIVAQLVECDFGCGADLDSLQLQAALLSHVVHPLEKLERDIYYLQMK